MLKKKKDFKKFNIFEDSNTELTDANVIASSKKHISLKDKLKIIKKLIAFGKPFHGYLYVALICIVLQTFFELLVPVFLGKCIDSIVGVGQVNFTHLLQMAGLLILFFVLNAIFTLFANVCTNKYCFKSSEYMRTKFFNKINSVPLSFIDRNQHGDLLSRMVNDIDILTDGILEGFATITNGVVTILGTLIFMFMLNIPLAVIVLVITPLSLLISLYIAKKSYKLFASEAKTEGDVNGYLEEMFSGGNVVKAFNYEEESIKKFDKINARFYKVSEKAEFYSTLANPVTRFINGLVYICVAICGCLFALQGHITIGLITTFLSYANSFGKPFTELSTEITEWQAALACSERVFEILETEDEPSDEHLPVLKDVNGNISVREINFSYVPKVKLIQNFNLEVRAGQKVAIVGPTGCGKTTFINLLMRFYDVNSGAIMIDSQSVTEVTRGSLRSQFGMVLQESWMFSASIRDNIAYGKPDATDKEILEVSKLTSVDDFVSKLPECYNTLITEGGTNISQGQKQLICIARIMLMNPKMLILDEATSNIDTRTEIKIQEAFDNLMKGRTSFIVAHRLSTIKSADIILVMNKGNIVEQGTHEELLEKHGFYYNLYNSQFAKATDE